MVHFVGYAADPRGLALVVEQRRSKVEGGNEAQPGRCERHRAPQRLVVGRGR